MQPALAWRLGGILPVQGRRVDSVGLGRSMSIFASSFLRAFLRSRRGRTSSVSLCSTRDLNAAAARRFARQRSARRFEPVLSRKSIRLRGIGRRANARPGCGGRPPIWRGRRRNKGETRSWRTSRGCSTRLRIDSLVFVSLCISFLELASISLIASVLQPLAVAGRRGRAWSF